MPSVSKSERPQPLFPQIGVIGLVPESWGPIWGPRHQTMTRLARYFNVVWMEPARHWRDEWKRGPVTKLPPLPSPGEIAGFQVYRPGRWLPSLHRPRFVAERLERRRLSKAAAMLRKAGARTIVLYIWRPEFGWAVDAMPNALSCYHIDDEYSFSPIELPIDPVEAALIGRVDQVIIHSRGLWGKKAHLASDPAFVPNGVDFPAFAARSDEPADMRAIPHPRVGYVGVIRRFLNLPLMLELARRHTQWSFVFVGPARTLHEDQEAFDALCKLPNVYALGSRPVTDLPGYASHLDVAVMPYDVDGYTKFIYPLKLHEYLAAGVPVVGTPIPTLQEFDGTIAIAADADGWSAALSAALEPSARSGEAVASRQAVARDHDWSTLIHRIAVRLAKGVGGALRDQVEAAAPPVATVPSAVP
jgi:glycosyltransferase involved in cell wall biosynthesis